MATRTTKTTWGFRNSMVDGKYSYEGLTIEKAANPDKNGNPWEIITFGMFNGIPSLKVASPQTDLPIGQEFPAIGTAVVEGTRLVKLHANQNTDVKVKAKAKAKA